LLHTHVGHASLAEAIRRPTTRARARRQPGDAAPQLAAADFTLAPTLLRQLDDGIDVRSDRGAIEFAQRLLARR
jgi:hypothetical protein